MQVYIAAVIIVYMGDQTSLKRILHFTITKMIIPSAIVVGSVALMESAGRSLIDRTQLSTDLKNIIIAIAESLFAVTCYVVLFRYYEKRKVRELSASTFLKNALIGFFMGLMLQSVFILIIYLSGGFAITRLNPVSYLLPAFAFSFTAGFVAEILLRGILFRLTEEKTGTIPALIIFTLLFGILHVNSKGATAVSVCATAMQAGLLLSAAYVYSRSLWLPVFVHFAWDFAEPGIYGGINPGISTEKSLLCSKITGSYLVTGGEAGPGNSVQSAILCLMTSLLFLWLAKRNGNFIKPWWNVSIKAPVKPPDKPDRFGRL
jgi:membrane protease YdiL (CAAX protease family)